MSMDNKVDGILPITYSDIAPYVADANIPIDIFVPIIADFASYLNIIAATFAFLPVLITYSAIKRFCGKPILMENYEQDGEKALSARIYES